MMVIYDQQTKKIVSYAGQVFDNGQWREHRLEDLYPNRDVSQWGVVFVKDAVGYAIPLDELQLRLNDQGTPIGVERKPKPPRIFLSTSATDSDGDGLPELPADSQTKVTITAEVKNSSGEILPDDRQIQFTTTAGTLSARKVQTQMGQAIVEFNASLETVTATVTATAEGIQGSSITFEFMPPG